MKPPRSRFRHVAKWVGLVVCAWIVVVWALSHRWNAEWTSEDGNFQIWLIRGRIDFSIQHVVWRSERSKSSYRHGLFIGEVIPLGWFAQTKGHTDGSLRTLSVPLWTLLLIVGGPTCYFFWRDRRRPPPGHCQQCGYNLTGNTSGTCPECGTEVPTP